MAVKEFSREYLMDELDVLCNSVSDEITGTSRWSVFHTIVFQDKDGKFYEANYSCGATEMQNEGPWEYEDIIECVEVEQREVPVKQWVSVDTPKPKAATKKKAKKDEIEIDPEVAKKKIEMNDLVEQIKEVDFELTELQAMYTMQLEKLKAAYEEKKLVINGRRLYFENQLKVLFEQVPTTDTKTQRKVSLLFGDVVVKKATKTLDCDKKALLEVAEHEINQYMEKQKELIAAIESVQSEIDRRTSEDPTDATIEELVNKRIGLESEYEFLGCEWLPFVKTKEVKDFDWSAFKARLVITEGGIIDTETGELVEVEGLTVKEVPEEVQVKY